LKLPKGMMEAIQVFPELMQIAGDLVVKAQDWPGSEELAERLRKTIPPQLLSDKEKAEMGQQAPDMQAIMQQQAQVQEAMQKAQEELDKLQKENFSLKIKADIEAKKLEIEEYRAETERLNAYAAIAKTDEEINIKRLEQQAANALDVAEHLHGATMDVMGHAQDDEQFEQTQELQQRQADQAAAQSDASASTPPSE
jgi:hypothetical protein